MASSSIIRRPFLMCTRHLSNSANQATGRNNSNRLLPERKAPSAAPFESHLSSATARHREERQVPTSQGAVSQHPAVARVTVNVGANSFEPSSRQSTAVLMDATTATGYQHPPTTDVAAVVASGGRIHRNDTKVFDNSGSVAATLSATTKHRRDRKLPPEGQKMVVNPSAASIPVSTQKDDDISQDLLLNEKHDSFLSAPEKVATKEEQSFQTKPLHSSSTTRYATLLVGGVGVLSVVYFLV